MHAILNESNLIFHTTRFQQGFNFILYLHFIINDLYPQTFSRAVTKAVSGTDSASGSDTEKLGEKAPIWVPDGRVTMCQECHVEFTLIVRRHHCRACGRVICNACSNCEAPLKWNDFKAERVCYICYEELRKSTSLDKIYDLSYRH